MNLVKLRRVSAVYYGQYDCGKIDLFQVSCKLNEKEIPFRHSDQPAQLIFSINGVKLLVSPKGKVWGFSTEPKKKVEKAMERLGRILG